MLKKFAVFLIPATVLAGVLWYELRTPAASPTSDTATSTAATTTDIFTRDPIIPEAKVSTDGWKTCRNEEYGYEFKFPAEWHIYGEDALGEPIGGKRFFVRESEECNGAVVVIDEHGIETYQATGVSFNPIHVFVQPLSDSQHVTDREFAAAQDSSKSTLTPVLVGDQAAVLQVYLHASMYSGRAWTMWAANSNNSYNLSSGLFDDRIDLIYTILSTFRFLEETSTTTTTTP